MSGAAVAGRVIRAIQDRMDEMAGRIASARAARAAGLAAPVTPTRRARKQRSRGARLRRRALVVLAILVGVVVVPIAFSPTVAGAAGPCDLSPDLAPEIVGAGMDGLVKPPPAEIPGAVTGAPSTETLPPGAATGTTSQAASNPATNYERYGMSGLFWHTYQLGCTDVTAVLGNAWANTVFLWAKTIDRMTISTYQAAATEGPLQSIKDVVDDIVTNLANAMYWPYLRVVILLGAVWLAWYGLIRKRASTTAEGVIWMILAVTVAVWFFSRPGDFTGLGKAVTDRTTEVVNSAFSGLPGAGGASCLPLKGETNPKAGPGGYGQSGVPGVDQNADALWSTLVCKPWLMGEFGTADPKVVASLGVKLLDIQATDVQEQNSGQQMTSGAHQARYEQEIAKPLENTPLFFLFQGKDWTSRLGIAIGALMAAMVAGVLIFLVAVSLIALKVGFLLLLILGPVFLLIGVHPGSGRIIAMRWVEMLIGTLLRQAVLALVLGVLVYGYALIISTALPWGMQIMFIALLTIAVFFYRRPFQHLFARMDGHTLTTRMLGEAASAPTLSRATNALPPVAAARMGRWGLRKAEPIMNAAAMAGAAGAGTGAAATAASVSQARVRDQEVTPGATQQTGTRVPVGAQPAPLDADAQAGVRRKATGRGAAVPRPGAAPPLNLNGRSGGGAPGTPARSGGAPGAAGSRPATRTSTGSGSGSAGSAGSWFGGGSGGGWASRPGSSGSGGSSGGSSNGSSGGSRRSEGSEPRAPRSTAGGPRGILGGGGGGGGGSSSNRGSSGGSSRGSSGGSSRGSSGGGSSRSATSIFGSSGNGDRGSGWLSGERSGSDEAPPLWLPPRSDAGRGEDAPFWLRPADGDKD
ncbi:type IV secretion system protein [Sphaerisporangium sp. NPDC051017]|uniref:type IV secretion system protein n=1 Tax=Sphaerisporangium sp. NPDC051017 TaxID=3154636 RepID=UPI0034236DA4